MMLNTDATQLAYDDMYEALIGCHQGLSTEQSHMVNARLVLLLANHIADLDVLREAFAVARSAAQGTTAMTSMAAQAISPVAPVHAG
jgi:hypothetical protein